MIERRHFTGVGTVAGAALAAAIVAVGAAGQAPEPPVTPPERVALTHVRILPIIGEPIQSGTILIERGKIKAVGRDVDVPYDAREFDLTGKTVMPGCMIANTPRGMDVTNEQRPVTPQLDVADAIDPSQLYFEDALRTGVTAIHIMPGPNTVVGGVGRVVRPIGLSVAEMTILPDTALKISTSPRSGYERMRQMAELREAFAELDEYLRDAAEKAYEQQREEDDKPLDVLPEEAAKRGVKLLEPDDISMQFKNLLRLTGGVPKVDDEAGERLLPPLGAFVYAGGATDVGPAVGIAKQRKFFDRLVLVLGPTSWKAVDELKQAARPVVLPEDLIYREEDPLTGKVTETFIPREIFDAGLTFALLPGENGSLPERLPTYQAARCVRNGIPRDVALAAITINPAKMCGLESRLGSIEVGKDAHLVVYDGDPLDFNSVVEYVFIDGIPAYDRSKDVRIQRLLNTNDEQ